MTTNYAAEQLRKTIRACGGFSNDHDYIARARPVDLINAAKEIDDLTARLAAAEKVIEAAKITISEPHLIEYRAAYAQALAELEKTK